MDDFSELDAISIIEIEELGETIPGDWAPKSTLTIHGFCEAEMWDYRELGISGIEASRCVS